MRPRSTLVASCLFVTAKATTSLVSDTSFYSAPRACPASCESTPDNWAVYSSVQRLQICEEPLLLDFAIFNPLSDPSTIVRIRTCTSGNATDSRNGLLQNDRRAVDYDFNSTTCVHAPESKASLELSLSTTQGNAKPATLRTAIEHLKSYLSDSIHCQTKFLIARFGNATVAVYSGAAIDNGRTVPSVLDEVENSMHGGSPGTAIMQLCGATRNTDYTFGVAIDTNGNLDAVQNAVAAWANGTCFDTQHLSKARMEDVSFFEAPLIPISKSSNSSAKAVHARAGTLLARGDCKTAEVAAGDSCASMAQKCGISSPDFTKYNPSNDMCSTLQPGQRVCCSAGTLPDIRPKPNSDGSCAVYAVQSGDYCQLIASKNGLTLQDLSDFNDKTTWGWSGCKNLGAGLKICLSKGSPPMPAWVPNAVCGPLKPGSKRPSSGNISDLNPCPLNACCDVWGQCGIIPDFCTPDTGATGNPGTAPPNKNGCVSNCGTDIKNNDAGPDSFMKVGYYESWNWDRPCLNYRANSMGGTPFTHAHWGFGTINPDFSVTVNDTYKQLPDFLALPLHKVLSFGGWGYSTDPATYDILRKAMDPANVDTFVSNVVSYLDKNGWDGVDIDWEYPGAPDIPGIPAGLASDGPNYLAFLKKLRTAADGKKKTVSIAAPASFWYLRAFPIADMAKELDYIVYMTYDLHGQWDYNNQWSQDGCLSGNCLRSHVNLTETMFTLAMITKAGVPTNKINVGVSSYGRSFGLHNRPACEHSLSSPGCTFLGPDSGATPGNCTATAGYISNAEIDEIMNLNITGTNYVFDAASDSDTLYYGNNWVAYMSDTTKNTRTEYYNKLKFAGTVDWAVDLSEFTDDDGTDPKSDDDDDDDPDPVHPLAPCDASYSTFDDLDAHADSIPEHCVTLYTVQALKSLLTESLNNYTDLVDHQGYDGKFNTYSHAVADQAGGSLKDFIDENGNSYASCTISELSICCSACKANSHSDSYCDYCFSDGKCYKTCNAIGCTSKRGDGGSTQVLVSHEVNATEPCPPDYSKRGYGPDNPYEQSVYWTWNNDTGFYAQLELDTGIPKDKTKLGNYDFGNDCAPSAKPDDSCWGTGMYYNVPLINGYSASDVANPKDVVSKSLDKVKDLPDQIDKTVRALNLNGYLGDGYELIDSLSLPVLMLASATENMATVVDVADKIDEAKRKAFILAFLSAIFLLVPVLGEIIGSVAELADISAITALVGAAGNAAVDIYTIVDDPDNAPLAIFDLILTPLSLADTALIAKAADLRRGMKAEDLAKLGDKVKGKMDTIEKVKGACVKNMAE